jgi:hypothetical protein
MKMNFAILLNQPFISISSLTQVTVAMSGIAAFFIVRLLLISCCFVSKDKCYQGGFIPVIISFSYRFFQTAIPQKFVPHYFSHPLLE